MENHLVLVLEGGGAKGPVHVGELQVLEETFSKKLCEMFDLFVTTSIGGVEASIYCTGKLWVKDFWKLLEPNLKNIFSSKWPLSIPRYDWKVYKDLYEKSLGKGIVFGDSKIPFMFTTTDLVTSEDHFIKSWKEEYKNHDMPSLVRRTFSAPFFFGAVYDKEKRAMWSDGGVGFFNLPLIEAYAQILTNGWLKEGHHTHILALGTGRKKYELDFDEEYKKNDLARAVEEVKRFMSKDQGGLARAASARTNVNTVRKLINGHDGALSFQWVDWFPMPDDLDKMDNWKARWEYYNKGLELGKLIDLTHFKF